MKKSLLKKSLTTGCLMLCLFQLTANNLGPFYKVKLIKPTTFILEVDNSASDISINVMDRFDKILATKDISKNQGIYLMKIKMKNLPDGVYNLVVENNIEIKETNIRLINNQLELEETPKSTFKPVLRQNGAFMDVNALLKEDCALTVSIYGSEDTPIYQKVIAEKTTFHKRYDLSQLESAHYTFKVKIGDHTFYKSIYVH